MRCSYHGGVSILYLNRREVSELLPPILEQIDLVEATYKAMAAGRVELPPKPGIHPRPNAFIHAMPAYLRDGDVAAMKWVSGYPTNQDRGLPYISGLIVVNDAATGVPVAVMDAAEITAARTAAASGVCVRKWAAPNWRRAAILGCGEQGRRHALVLRELKLEISISAYDPDPARVAGLPVEAEPSHGPREAVEGAEIVITAGPILEDSDPVISCEWLGDEYLLLPVDFDSYLLPEVVHGADLFVVDDEEQFEYYRGRGHFGDWPKAQATVGAALSSEETVRRVVCCNLGVGALDAAFADKVLKRAESTALGTRLES